MEYPKFSVLMSLYIKEKTQYFKESMDSILASTVLPDEILLVLDGPINKEQRAAVEEYKAKYPEMITIQANEKNQGLGLALQGGVLACRNEMIARMDTDDITYPDRFEKQLKYFMEHPDTDVLGGHIVEFDGTTDNIISQRKVPIKHEDIANYQKQRAAVNHVTVMFKKSAVLSAGNYQHAPIMEDNLLWIHMLMNGARFANLDENIVYVRAGADMIDRRGGWSYFKRYRNGRKLILATGYISYWDYLKTIIAQFGVTMMPKGLRKVVFLKLLRK